MASGTAAAVARLKIAVKLKIVDGLIVVYCDWIGTE